MILFPGAERLTLLEGFNMQRFGWKGLVAVIGSACVTGGCQAPVGDSGGRVEIHRTTDAERGAPGMSIGDMASASDRVAQSLIRDLNRLVAEDFVDPTRRVWLKFGDIQNESYTMPSSDFRMIRERIKDKLGKSRMWRDNIKFAAGRREMERLIQAEFGSNQSDPFADQPAQPTLRIPEQQHTYFLRGKAFGVHRGSTEMYYVSFNLTRASDGEEVFSQEYEVKYR